MPSSVVTRAPQSTSSVKQPSGGDLFIVDNSDRTWTASQYLHDWADIAHAFDIATGYFEIGALLALDGQWQKLDKIRILMGDEVSMRTHRALTAGIETVRRTLDDSLEREKEKNDFLTGVPAIVQALHTGTIECRVYTKEKFHAKAYITHAKQAVLGSFALVGSSNFTLPGLTDNVELNIQIRREVDILQDWYERHWNEAQDITPEILTVIERHTREYSPFEVFVKALHEFFRKHVPTISEWERTDSKVYPILDEYQQEGYHALMKIARQYGGAFLCDGVGLGKTFIGMMVIERLLFERKRVVLLVPKAARAPVWEAALKRYLPGIGAGGDFTNLVIFNHTDLGRGGEYAERWERVKDMADAIVIDEAHHFRNPGLKGDTGKAPSRYRRLYDIAEDKTLFLLTATPINNRLTDLQHMIELFSRGRRDYFKEAPLGIHSLPGHFRKMEKDLQKQVQPKGNGAGSELADDPVETNEVEAEQVLSDDNLFKSIVVQRSRAYVKKSQLQQGGVVSAFPQREDPRVADYSVKKTYGRLLSMMEAAFSKDKPLFSLAIYYPLAYYKGPDAKIDPLVEGRQRQVVGLIRTGFLKRFESSAEAFGKSCQALLLKLLAFVTKHSSTPADARRLERWKAQHAEMVGYVQNAQIGLYDLDAEAEDPEDIITEEMLEAVEELSRDHYKVDEILDETYLDLDQIAYFLEELKKFKPSHDDKLLKLKQMLKSDPALKNGKVLIFTQFTDTARYLRDQLQNDGLDGVDEVDGGDKRDRGAVIRCFSPYYNGSSSAELAAAGLPETRILISTDVLSEGLNLQDAARLINYDLHWNPVRIMQRIGRVDRRLDPQVENRLLADHPDQAKVRGTVIYWNFLPPDDLESLLKLYERVSHKTLRISKVFGIEGKKLLKPEDDFAALKDFVRAYEGETTPLEELSLEYQRLLTEQEGLAERLDGFPGKIFSGKRCPEKAVRGVFFCYNLPAPEGGGHEGDPKLPTNWTQDAGDTRWYYYDLANGVITEEAGEIVHSIRSAPDTPRQCILAGETLAEARGKVERHIKNSYFRSANAPAGVKASLKAWMEVA